MPIKKLKEFLDKNAIKDDKLAMAVLPATKKVDIGLLKKASGANQVVITGEEEFKDVFPECDIGAMPPARGALPKNPPRASKNARHQNKLA